MEQFFRFVSKEYSTSIAGECKLQLALGSDSISYAVFYPLKNKFLIAAHQACDAGSLNQVLEDSGLLVGFKEVRISLSTPAGSFTFIPNLLFDETNLEAYLRLAGAVHLTELTPQVNALRFSQAKCVFGVKTDEQNELHRLFPGLKLYHSAASFVDGLIFHYRILEGKALFINQDKEHFELTILDGRRLVLYNRYATQSNTDVLYYSLLCCKNLDLDPKVTPLHLYGDQNPELINLLSRSFKTVQWGDIPANVQYPDELKPEHKRQLFSVFNLQVCE